MAKDANIVMLIEKVRDNPCLWDLSDQNYKITKVKAEIWERIASETQIGGKNFVKKQSKLKI